MASSTVTPGPVAAGATVLGAAQDHPRHRLADALHAIRVFAVAAAEVVLLGNEGKRY